MIKVVQLLLFSVLFLVVKVSSAQSQRTISGFVTNASSGEALYGAKIYDTISKNGTVSNEYGFYSLTIPNQQAVFRITYLGLDRSYVTVPVNTNELDLFMNKSVQELDAIVVSGKKSSIEETNAGTFELSLEKVEKLPVFMGEKDVIKTLQLFPGVSSGGEGTSGLYVRGGGPDQNLVLLDGVPIYNANHLFGFFSVFNSDALSKVTMIKGGFPARYGGRTSSVLNMKMKEGNLKKYNTEGSIGLIASRLLVEGPIKKDKSAFMISARRTYIDALTRPIMAITDSNNSGGYFFYDLNTKVHYKLNNKHHVYVSGYFGKDKATFKNSGYYETDDTGAYSQQNNSEEFLKWGNAIGAARWNWRIGPRLFVNTTLTFSNYHFEVGSISTSNIKNNGVETSLIDTYQYQSKITDWSGKMDYTFIPSANHYIKFGYGDTYHKFTPGVFSASEQINQNEESVDFGSSLQFAHELFAYAENDHKLNNRIKINYGLHYSSFIVGQTSYNVIQPRLSANIIATDASSVKISYARTAQFLHLLSNTGIGLPTDLWVPATEKIEPILAHQVSLGYNYLFNNRYNLVIEGYYKKMNNQIQYKEGASFIGTGQDWQTKVEVGKGWSYGGELLLEKKKGDFTGWVGYTLSWTNRQFDNLNNGEIFPYTYDRRHDLSIALTYELNKKWDFGVVFVLASGRAVSLSTQTYTVANNPISYPLNFDEASYFSSINNYRMPLYHRLDLGANYHKQKKWGESTWSFSIYNVYSRQNAFYLFVDKTQNDPRLMQMALFPIIPSVSWKFNLNYEQIKKNRDAKKR